MPSTFTQSGSGARILALLPGWCSTSAVFASMSSGLSARNRVVAMEWRGHGSAPVPVTDFGISDLVGDAEAILKEAGDGEVVPIAISHAGWIALELQRRMPERIRSIVLVDWLVLDPPPPFLDALGALQNEHAWRDVREALFAMWRGNPPNAAVSDYLDRDMAPFGFEMWRRAGREIAHAYDKNGAPLAALASFPDPPRVRHIYAQPDDPGYLAAQQSFALEHPWFSVTKLDASTHFPAIEMPKTLVAEIERFLQ